VIHLCEFLCFIGVRVHDAREEGRAGPKEGSGTDVTHPTGADDEDLVPFGTLVLGGGGGGGVGMTRERKEEGETVGLEQAAMVG